MTKEHNHEDDAQEQEDRCESIAQEYEDRLFEYESER